MTTSNDAIKTLYIEPTSECNLSCAMCSRTYWTRESTGHMTMDMFEGVIDSLPDSVERIFFGGVGEPLFHPHIAQMITAAKSTGRSCELITNGTLLSEEMICAIVDAGLDMLWVSLDNLHEASFSQVARDHDTSVMSNLKRFTAYRVRRNNPLRPRLGAAFVLMKDNLDDLERLIQHAEMLGINAIKTTHLIPYHPEMEENICYRIIYPSVASGNSGSQVIVDLPFIDDRAVSQPTLRKLKLQGQVGGVGLAAIDHKQHGYCKFVQEGMTFVRWDGEVCPCMSLLHDNAVYQQGIRRDLSFSSYGNVKKLSLADIWDGDAYQSFRERVKTFDFSPCFSCAACDLFEDNQTDCIGSPFPACGHCLWAHGLIQCP